MHSQAASTLSDEVSIPVDDLRIGLYVYLDLKWFEHPFAFNRFKIKNQEQIKVLRSLGLKTIRYVPSLSDVGPTLSAAQQDTASTSVSAHEEPKADAYVSPVLAAKQAMIERIKAQREVAARIESAFIDTAKTVNDVERNIFSRPAETVHQATKLIAQIANSILSAPDLAIHIMGDKMGGEELYFHSLNVTTLSMMMARDIGLPQELVNALGLGALFHDIGRKKIPDKILLKREPLTHAEQNFYELHCQYGVEIGKQLQFAPPILSIIHEHHEQFDGSGYPRKLRGKEINLLSRIVNIANYYDELCNPVNTAAALTPHDALSQMFAKLRGKFDPPLLQVFIRCLGVYPPGTIVQLSNGAIGMVATVNTAKPMKPLVVIYDPDIPKEEAILVDMEREADLNIVKAIRPSQVPQNVYLYLSPRKRVSYYFDAGESTKQAGKA